MNRRQQGSIIYVVVIAMAALMIYCMQIQRTLFYAHDIVMQREHNQKIQYATIALCNYMIEFIKEYFEATMDQLLIRKTIAVPLSPLPEPWSLVFAQSKAVVTFDHKDLNRIAVAVELQSAGSSYRTTGVIQRILHDDGTEAYYLNEWYEGY